MTESNFGDLSSSHTMLQNTKIIRH